MQEFYKVRVEFYDRRKVHLTNKLTEEWEKLDNKVDFSRFFLFLSAYHNFYLLLIFIDAIRAGRH
jgi:hypothetical protein